MTNQVFQSQQAQELIEYVRETYGDELEFLWQKFPRNAIWRNQSNRTWYSVLLVIPAKKIGAGGDELIEIIDLRFPKGEILSIVDGQKFFEGYHMNKNNWITIKLDGSVPTAEIIALLDQSYQISLKKSATCPKV